MTSRKVPAAELASPCPSCGSTQLTPALGNRALCVSCRRCWEVGGGLVRWVSPVRCEGCALWPLCSEPVERHEVLTVLSTGVRRRHRRPSPYRVLPALGPVGSVPPRPGA